MNVLAVNEPPLDSVVMSHTNDAALTFVARALELEPEHAEALGVAAYAYARAALYGWGLSRAEGLDKGIAAGERSIELDSDNADSIYSLAFLYYVAGQTRKAQELLRQCIEINRNHAPAYFFYGLSLIRLGQPRDAIAWVERAFELSPRDPLRSVWFAAIARAQLLDGNDALAIEAARQGVAANPKHSHNHAVLASAYAHHGQMSKAKASLATFLELQPGMTAGKYQRIVTADEPVAIEAYARLIAGLRRAGLPD